MKQRLAYLDNLKILLVVGVIAVHAAITYGLDGSWYLESYDQMPGAVVDLVTVVLGLGWLFGLGLFAIEHEADCVLAIGLPIHAALDTHPRARLDTVPSLHCAPPRGRGGHAYCYRRSRSRTCRGRTAATNATTLPG